MGPQRRIGGKGSSNYTKGVCFLEDARAKGSVGGSLDLVQKIVSGRLLEKLLLAI